MIEPELSENNSSNNHREVVSDDENNGTLELDGGFLVPNSNAFGHSFRSALVLKKKKKLHFYWVWSLLTKKEHL